MDAVGWTLVGIGLFTAGIIKGATGIGYATCALPVLTYVVGLQAGMALVLAPTFATNFTMALSSQDVRIIIRKFLPLYAAMLPGIAVGVALLAWADQRIAASILGALLVCYSVMSLVQPSFALSAEQENWLKIPVGFVSGALTGLTGSQVLPLVPYMLALDMEARQCVQAINVGVMVLTTILSGALLTSNVVDPLFLKVSLLAVIPALCGVAVGSFIRAQMPGGHLRLLVISALGVIGARMLLS